MAKTKKGLSHSAAREPAPLAKGKKPRRTAIVPRVVFSVAVGVSVVPSLEGCGPNAPPPPSSRVPVPVELSMPYVPSVAVVPPPSSAPPSTLAAPDPSGVDAGATTQSTEAPTKQRRRRAPRPVPRLDPPPYLGVAAHPHDWEVYGVLVE